MSLVPHTMFPAIKVVQLSAEGTVIAGRYDFSKTLDPFDSYLHKYEEGPLMDLVNAEASAEGALVFTRRWGPLRFDEFRSEDLFINEQIYRLSHKRGTGWLPPIATMPKNGFTVTVAEFIEEQRKVKNLLRLWRALRQLDLEEMRAALEAWPAEVWRVTDLREVFESDAAWLRKQVQQNTEKSLTWAAANCLHEACFRWIGLSSPLRPCLEIVEKSGVPAGFQFVQHARSLIDAIYFMVWLDLSKGQSLLDCANCGKTFVAKKRHQLYCSPHCTGAANARKSYRRRVAKKTVKELAQKRRLG